MKTNPNDLLNALQKKSVSYDENGREIIHVLRGGLTKREYFAAMAMQGRLANTELSYDEKEIAEDSVKCADALIEELNR
jgi:HEPN domain-containing protein